jgi:endonuclease-3
MQELDDKGLRKHAAAVVRLLRKAYPDAECALKHENAFQLLVATILSAQCTDERVNQVTPTLFERYPAPADLAAARRADIERIIQSTGFFRNKAKSIHELAQRLTDEFGGQVPQDIDILVTLPGIGRKTANVVLGTAFGIASGVVVDTHVHRISQRLGLTHEDSPTKIEQDLMQLLPKKEWIDYSHRVIHHGRQVCKARRPLCDQCSLAKNCPRVGVSPDSPD